MICEVCGADPSKTPGVILTRQNEFGVVGIWRCQHHNLLPVDPDLDDLCKTIAYGEPPPAPTHLEEK